MISGIRILPTGFEYYFRNRIFEYSPSSWASKHHTSVLYKYAIIFFERLQLWQLSFI